MDLNRVTIDENAKIHFDLERKAPKLGQDLYIVKEDGELTKNAIIKVEKGWTEFLFGGRGGIYVYTYTTPKGETLKKVYDGSMFNSEAKALVHRIDQFKSKVEELTDDINTIHNAIGLDVARLAEMIDSEDNGE